MAVTLGGVCHIFSEEMILPWFIKHHKPLFDEMTIIDHDSNDHSIAIIRALAPEWRIVKSKIGSFDAYKNDLEVMEWEKELKTDWKLTVNISEFLWKHDIKDYLANCKSQAIGVRSIIMVDDKERPLDYTEPIYKHRYHGHMDYKSQRRWRFIHNQPSGKYQTGRHGTNLSATYDPELFLLYFSLSPWPQCLKRKLQIQTRIPESDKASGLGFEHITTESKLRQLYENEEKNNLLNELKFKEQYDHFCGKI